MTSRSKADAQMARAATTLGIGVAGLASSCLERQKPSLCEGLCKNRIEATLMRGYAADVAAAAGYTLTLKRRLLWCSNFTVPSINA